MSRVSLAIVALLVASAAAQDEESVTYELDVPYANDRNPRHRLDIYVPKDRSGEALPVIVFFHGGGWMQGDKSDGAGRLMPFVQTGRYVGISVGYRLSGEAEWPAQIYDAKAAIRWIRANAATYNIDPDHIGVWGRDAGGNLALMLGVTSDVPALAGDIGTFKDVSTRVGAVANYFGATDFLALVDEPSDIDRRRADAPEARLIGGALTEYVEKARAASPATYVTEGDSPVLTVHGTEDPTVPYEQAVRLDASLRNAGVPSYLVPVEGGGHGDFGTIADVRVEAFFSKYLRHEDAEVSTRPIERSEF
jgi:acetyl esterase/lipase